MLSGENMETLGTKRINRNIGKKRINLFNPFRPNVSFLYPLKTLENVWFSTVAREYKTETFGRNGLDKTITIAISIFSQYKSMNSIEILISGSKVCIHLFACILKFTTSCI